MLPASRKWSRAGHKCPRRALALLVFPLPTWITLYLDLEFNHHPPSFKGESFVYTHGLYWSAAPGVPPCGGFQNSVAALFSHPHDWFGECAKMFGFAAVAQDQCTRPMNPCTGDARCLGSLRLRKTNVFSKRGKMILQIDT